MKRKNIIILVLLFITINVATFVTTQMSLNKKIDMVLDNNLKTLDTHFKVLNTAQKYIANDIYKSIIRNSDAIKFLKQSYTATKEQNDKNRKALYSQLQEQYKTAHKQGIVVFQFVDKNNISFLRIHKPSKYGDDLTNIRADFKYVNETKKPIRAFTQGRTTHAFRNTFPLFDKQNNHIGALELSFSSENYQWYLNKVSGIHSNFLVDKDIFDTNAWKREDMIVKYTQSSENKRFMLALSEDYTKESCVIENSKQLAPIHNNIIKKMELSKSFSSYVEYKNKPVVISFLPIKNMENKSVAWIVAYTNSELIKSTICFIVITRVVLFFISIILIYFLVIQIRDKEKIEQQAKQAIKDKLEIERTIEINKQHQQQIFEQSKSAQMGDMIGNIAHQWRQPLSVISTAASGIIMRKEYGIDIDDEKEKEVLKSIVDTTQFLSSTIDTFRNYLKEKKVEKEVILQERINNALYITSASLENNYIKVINEIDKVEPIKINLILGELSQVIINILNNAKDVIIENKINDGFIKISLKKDKDKAIISIQDNAGGIPKDNLSKIFNPYFTTKHQSQGTGLGLYMSKEIIEKHLNGKLYAKNIDNGAVFNIELPLDNKKSNNKKERK